MKNKRILKRTLKIPAVIMFVFLSMNFSCPPSPAPDFYHWTLSELEENAFSADPDAYDTESGRCFFIIDLVTPAEEDYLDSDCFARISAAVKSNLRQYDFIIDMRDCSFKSDDIYEVPAGAFKDCSNLLSLTLPDQITHIGAGAFENCRSLTYLNGYVRYLGPGALTGTKIDADSFNYSFWITFREFEEGIIPDDESVKNVYVSFKILSDEDLLGDDCFEKAGEVLRRSEYSEKSFRMDFNADYFRIYREDEDISSVPEEAFKDCTCLKKIYLPKTVRNIGSKAFKNCTKLEYVSVDWTDIKDSYWEKHPGRCTVAPDAFEGCPLME